MTNLNKRMLEKVLMYESKSRRFQETKHEDILRVCYVTSPNSCIWYVKYFSQIIIKRKILSCKLLKCNKKDKKETTQSLVLKLEIVQVVIENPNICIWCVKYFLPNYY